MRLQKLRMRHKRTHRVTKTKMARRRRSSGRSRSIFGRAKRGFSRKGGLGGIRGLFMKASAGIGGGEIAEQMVARFSPQAAPIASAAGAYIAGGFEGLASKVVFDMVTGGGGLLSTLGLGSIQTNAPTTEVI